MVETTFVTPHTQASRKVTTHSDCVVNVMMNIWTLVFGIQKINEAPSPFNHTYLGGQGDRLELDTDPPRNPDRWRVCLGTFQDHMES